MRISSNVMVLWPSVETPGPAMARFPPVSVAGSLVTAMVPAWVTDEHKIAAKAARPEWYRFIAVTVGLFRIFLSIFSTMSVVAFEFFRY